ncbi:hypothetical protein ACKX2D_09865 [Lachnospiraceae bacterium YH-ros2226]
MVGGYNVITLCGSTRFKDEFYEVQKRLTPEEYERYVEEGKEPESFEYTHGKRSIQVNIDHGKNRE